jgi:hypothetical protein
MLTELMLQSPTTLERNDDFIWLLASTTAKKILSLQNAKQSTLPFKTFCIPLQTLRLCVKNTRFKESSVKNLKVEVSDTTMLKKDQLLDNKKATTQRLSLSLF